MGAVADKESILSVDEAIVFISRTDARPIFREALEESGIRSIASPKSVQECIALLQNQPHAMLVIDWENGHKDVAQILSQCMDRFSSTLRPVYLLCRQISSEVVGTCFEYHVKTVHSGDISRDTIFANIAKLGEGDPDLEEIYGGLVEVKKARDRAKWDESESMLRSLVDKHPSENRLKIELASDLIGKRQWDEAEELLDVTLMTEDLNLRALHLKARCLMNKSDYEGAITLLEKAQIFNPFHPERLVDLGGCLLQVDRIKDAHKAFDASLELDSGMRSAVLGKAQCHLADSQIDQALELLADLSGPKELASLFNNAAILAIRHDRFNEGVKLYESAISVLGEKPIPRTLAKLIFNLGLGFSRWDKLDEALECFEKAAALDPAFRKAAHNAKAVAIKLDRDTALPLNIDETIGGVGSTFETDLD